MLFVVQFEDVYAEQPERLPERRQHMPAHLAFLAQHPDKVVAAGALRESQEGTPLGGIWIVNAPDQATVEASTNLTLSGRLACAAVSASTIGQRLSGRLTSLSAWIPSASPDRLGFV